MNAVKIIVHSQNKKKVFIILHNPTGKERIGLAFLLGMLGILGPLNIDMYLPSFPGIASDLETNVGACPPTFYSGKAVGVRHYHSFPDSSFISFCSK